jgi:uroporphyrinogen decarboxylase
MTIRSKYLAAMRRQSEAYVPFSFWLCPSLQEEFKRRTGVSEYWEYYGFPIKGITAEYVGKRGKFAGYHAGSTDVDIDPEWGYGHKKGNVAHFTELQPSMARFESLAEFEAYPYPDPVPEYNWAAMPDRVRAIQSQDRIAVANMGRTLFEIAWHMRGMEGFLVDMVLYPELTNYQLDRVGAIRCEFARRYAAAGCDILGLGDDVSTQLAMMMKVETWREYLKPRLAAVIRAAKAVKPDILVYYHGDGNLQAIIPELIEIGVEILNPIQPECMDPVAIKRQYGDRLSFSGTVGTQTTMPFATPDEVRQVCRQRIRDVGRGGGLSLAPTHVLEPEVPWANIQAFIETVQEHNAKRH